MINMEEQILTAAEKLFLEHGFAKTSTARIAQEAGCNTALIHYYYRTKSKLFEKIFQQKTRQLVDNIATIPLTELTFEHKIERIVATHFDFICNNPRLPFLLLNEISTNAESMAMLKQEFAQAASSIIDMVQQELDAHLGPSKMSALDLMLNIVSLNVMSALMQPIVNNLPLIEIEQFTAQRRKNIIETIIKSLRYE